MLTVANFSWYDTKCDSVLLFATPSTNINVVAVYASASPWPQHLISTCVTHNTRLFHRKNTKTDTTMMKIVQQDKVQNR